MLRKKGSDTSQNQTEREGVETLLELPNLVVLPVNLMEPLLMAIAYKTRDAVACSLTDIRLYNLYDKNDGSFIGSSYMLEFDGRYYGNVVGNPYIFTCSASAFRFKATKELLAPIKTCNDVTYVLRCQYDCKTTKFAVMQLEKITDTSDKGQVLRKFDESVSFHDALQLSKELMP